MQYWPCDRLISLRVKSSVSSMFLHMAGFPYFLNSMEVPQKIKNRTTMYSSNSTSEYLTKIFKIRILKRY